MLQKRALVAAGAVVGLAFCLLLPIPNQAGPDDSVAAGANSTRLHAPAGTLPATQEVFIDGYRAAVLPNGRLITPAGTEVNVDAPTPYGLALSPDGRTLATINSGASRFSITLIRSIQASAPQIQRINVNA